MFAGRALSWAVTSKTRPDGSREKGAAQVVDLGCGFPPAGRTHEMIRSFRGTSRVACVDIDPGVIDNVCETVTPGDRSWVAAVQADIRDPARVFTAIREAGPGPGWSPPGSYVAISATRVDDAAMQRELTTAGLLPRLENFTREQFAGLFGGLRLEASGIAPMLGLRLGGPMSRPGRRARRTCSAGSAANLA